MCGITGVLSFDRERPVNRALLNDMTRLLDHRGPDATGNTIIGPLGLGHTRLKVIDLIGGQQPVVDPDSRNALVFNGEIYNFRSLQPAGFQSNSDTETLFHLLRFNNDDWLHQLNGMFAFAAWDNQAEQLLLVRDRVGIKPLYYTIAGNQFLFASEIKSLLIHPAVKRSVRMTTIPEFLGFRSTPEPVTQFEGIHSLPPGHSLRISMRDQTPQVNCWWSGAADLAAAESLELSGEPVEQLRSALSQAIDYRLVSDVPVGTYNSGGIDSSLITALVREKKPGNLHTFSVGFEDKRYDETPYSDIVAKTMGTQHHRLLVSGADYAGLLNETLWFNDTPIVQPHTPQLLALSRLAKEYVTVVLTGEGADETWAGYPRYQIPMLARKLEWLPDIVKKTSLSASQKLGLRRLTKLFDSIQSFTESYVQASRFIVSDSLRTAGVSGTPDKYRRKIVKQIESLNLSPLETVLAYDRRTYMVPLMQRLDRTTMASAVEARVPFLDHRLISWGMQQPQTMKMKLGRDNKVLLKLLAEQYFPHELIHRRKMGFDVPLKEWFRESGILRDHLDLIMSERFFERGYADRKGVKTLVDQHLAGEIDNSEILFSMLNLEMWTQMFITGEADSPNDIFNRRIRAADSGHDVAEEALVA